MPISTNMEGTKGLRAEYKGQRGFIRFVDTQYVVLQLDNDNPDPQRQVGLCIYQQYWDQINFEGDITNGL